MILLNSIVYPITLAFLEEVLITGMGKSFTISLEANCHLKTRMPVHRSKAKSVFLPLYGLIRWQTPINVNRLWPVARKAVGFRMSY